MIPLADGELGLADSVKADYAAFRSGSTNSSAAPSRLRLILDILTWPGFVTVVIYRCARASYRVGLFPLARALTYLNLVLHSAEFHPSSVIGPGFVLLHPQGCGTSAGVRIGARCRMLKGVALGAGGYDDPERDGVPVVGDDVLLCDRASVWGPVTIGDRSVIGAGVRLFKSVPSDSKVICPQRQMVISRLDESPPSPVAEVGEPRLPADAGTSGDGARRRA